MNFTKSSIFLGILLSGLEMGAAIAITPPPKTSPTRGYGITFAQVSSLVDQPANQKIQFESQDAIQGMTATKDAITVLRPGSYLIIASPQVTATADNGCVDVWLVLNNKDVPNSGVRLCQGNKGNTDVIVSQTILNLKKGDTIQVASTGTGVKLDAIQPQKGAMIPSIILTVLGLSTSAP